MKLNVLKGRTSLIVGLFIQDSTSTVGAGRTGLLFNTSSLSAYYSRSDQGNAGGTVISLVTATRGAFTSGGFIEKDATNLPGVYELGIPNAALATGSDWVIIMLKGASAMAPMVLEIALVDYNPQNATTLGLTNLDATISSRMATFALPTNFSTFSIDASGRVDVGRVLGTAQTARDLGANCDTTISSRMATFTLPTNFSTFSIDASGRVDVSRVGGTTQTARDLGASVLLSAGTGTGQLDFTSGVVKANLVQVDAVVNSTHAAGMVPADLRNIAGAALSTSTAQLGVNAVQCGGTALTGRDIAAGSRLLKNTAYANFTFPMFDSTDHVTPKTGLTITATRSIDGGTMAACANAASEIATTSGLYKISLAATDLNGDNIIFKFTATGADPTTVSVVTQVD